MGYQEIAVQLGAIIFSDIRHPEKICKYFSCIPTGTIDKKLLTEYIAFNVFIVDYSLYAFGASRNDYQQIKRFLFDTFVSDFWQDLYSRNMLSDDIGILNSRLHAYSQIFQRHEPNDIKLIGYCCAQILKFAGYKEHIDKNPSEYADFRFGFFDSATLAYIKQTNIILNEDKPHSTNNTKFILLCLFVLLAILIWVLS